MDSLTELEDNSIFKMERQPSIPAEQFDYTQFEVAVELNLDLQVINRTYYTLLDCLSDVGGMLQVLMTTVAVCLTVFNYQHLDNYMATNLFRLQAPQNSESKAETVDGPSNGNFTDREKQQTPMDGDKELSTPSCCNFVDFFCDLIPKWCKCCCSNNSRDRNGRALT